MDAHRAVFRYCSWNRTASLIYGCGVLIGVGMIGPILEQGLRALPTGPELRPLLKWVVAIAVLGPGPSADSVVVSRSGIRYMHC